MPDLLMLTQAPLRVALTAHEGGRLGSLLAALATEGIEADTDAALTLVDLAPGEALPADPDHAVILTDDPAVSGDPDLPAVLPRRATPGQIAAALTALAAGLTVRHLAPVMAPGFAESPADQRDEEPRALLTPRELDILAAIGDGLSNKGVARRLGISAHTVKFHLEAIFAKLGARTRVEAVRKGLRRGLIEA